MALPFFPGQGEQVGVAQLLEVAPFPAAPCVGAAVEDVLGVGDVVGAVFELGAGDVAEVEGLLRLLALIGLALAGFVSLRALAGLVSAGAFRLDVVSGDPRERHPE